MLEHPTLSNTDDTPANADGVRVEVRERITLKKYDGDLPRPGAAKAAAETVTIELVNGAVVRRTVQDGPDADEAPSPECRT